MNHPPAIHLQLDETCVLSVDIRRQTTERSPHSGKEMVELHGLATVADAPTHRVVAELLRGVGDRPVQALDDSGDFAGKWCVSWNSYALSGELHTYTLLLREAEDLSLEALVIEGVDLHPYEYREEVVGNGLTIRAKVIGAEDDVIRLRALMRSRTTLWVTRRGIHEEPREMRLGVAEWSQAEERIKYRLVLVDRELDSDGRSELARIEEEKNRAALGFYASFLERLADVMVAKGVLTREELQSLKDEARADPGVGNHEMWRVADVDDL